MTTDRQTAKKEIKDRTQELLERLLPHAKQYKAGRPQYVCPICGHGTNGDGLCFVRDSKTELKCFGGVCSFNHGDIIALYQAMHPGKNVYETINDLAGILGADIEKTASTDLTNAEFDAVVAAFEDYDPDAPHKANEATPAPSTPTTDSKGEAEAKDYTDYYGRCEERLDDVADYLAGRGISMQTARAYHLGYDPAADPASNPGGGGRSYHPAPRLIIPVSKAMYMGRRVDGGKEFTKVNSKGSIIEIFNLDAIWGDGTVFVVEGAIDALSVIEGGYPAIGLNSVANADRLVNALYDKPTDSRVIVALDADAAGQGASAKLVRDLDEIGVTVLTANICCGKKDPNEALCAGRAAFKAALAAAASTSVKPDSDSSYILTEMQGDFYSADDCIPTGFSYLDKRMGGGLFPGLYFLAAISSLGKTTFCRQLADQIAAAGRDVLFFSLEQTRLEMTSKSLAREIALHQRESGEQDAQVITSLDIRRGFYPKHRQDAAVRYHEKVGDRISTVTGLFSVSVDTIKTKAIDYINRTGVKPVVVIDYLQILEPLEDDKKRGGISIREQIDHNLKALKVFSGEQGLTILCVASVNRMSYLTPISFEALKESGNIEYDADAVFGLQLQCVHGTDFQDETKGKVKKNDIIQFHKNRCPRLVELVCLKGRTCSPGFKAYFEYLPAQELFLPDMVMETGSREDKAFRAAGIAAEFAAWQKRQDLGADTDSEMDFDSLIEQDEKPKRSQSYTRGKAVARQESIF